MRLLRRSRMTNLKKHSYDWARFRSSARKYTRTDEIGTYEIILLLLSQFPISILKVRDNKVLSGKVLENFLINRLVHFYQSQKLRWGGPVVLLVSEERFVVYRRSYGNSLDQSLRFFNAMGHGCRIGRDSSSRGGRWKDSRHRAALEKVGWWQ